MKKFIWLALALIIIFAGWFLFFKNSSLPIPSGEEPQEVSGEITSFYLSKPNLVVETTGLESVSLHATPADRRQEDFLLGEAKLVEKYGQRRTWVFEIPKPQLLRKIYAIGTDSFGLTTERSVFPIAGIKDIYNSLWTEIPEEIISLSLNQQVSVLGNDVFLKNVLEDSRCPETADCIHAGRLVVSLLVNENEYVLSSNDEELHVDDLYIKIIKVEPRATGEVIEPEKYVVSFSVIYEE